MTAKEIIEKVENGASFRTDFRHRKFYLNGKELDLSELAMCNKVDMETAISMIEHGFNNFQRSIPTAKSDRKRFCHFTSSYELTDEDYMYGITREVALCDLELHLLLFIINGSFTWDMSVLGEKAIYCWHSKNYPSLVIFRKWVDQEYKFPKKD